MAEELEHTEAAEKARKAWRTASRRSVQKGGVLWERPSLGRRAQGGPC